MTQRRRFIGAGAAVLATGALIALPAFSIGATTEPQLRAFDSVTPRATSSNPTTEPPLHGSNPHGQGSVAVVDLTPSAERPLAADPSGASSNEDLVIGRSRGEQRGDGKYHGHITVAALFGSELITGADTGEGQTVDTGVAQDLLDGLCTSTGICLSAVRIKSQTTATGSTNSFSLASATVGRGGLPALSIGAAESQGNISADANCQTSRGHSRVANVSAAGSVVANVSESSTDSSACRSPASSSQTNTSSVVQVGQTPLNLPLTSPGCANGVADTVTGLPPLVEIVCNADDSSTTGGAQATGPYGVRNALDVYVLALGNAPLAKVSTAGSESRAAAPAAPATTTTTTTTTTTPAATTTTATTPAAAATTVPAATTTTPATTSTDDGAADDTGSGDDGTGAEDDSGAADDGGGGATECSDGVDNDGDGKIDFGSDPGCASADDDSEDDAAGPRVKQLPFTGTDVVVLGLAGLLLLASGVALRGPARRREH